jgi:DHA1 family multidrug resistance protein-like MFS transporter
VLLAIFWLTSMVEGLGVSQIFAFLPTYLREMGVPEPDRLQFVGLFGALIFVVGMPLVPLWGVWADKYSRKAVIIRSALVEAVVLAAIALSREPWQLAGSLLLVGLQLGNTGVMLAAIRDTAPRARIGTAVALFGSSGPIGFAVGPVIGGLIVDTLHWGLPAMFAVSASLTLATAILLALGSREVRPEVIPAGRTLELAFGAIRGVLSDAATRRIFAIFFVAFLANQVVRPYLPVLVAHVNGPAGEASAIGLVIGAPALFGAIVGPIGGWLGDRIGYRPVLVGSLLGTGLASLLMPLAPTVPILALVALAAATLYATVAPMVFALLATELDAAHRSQALNLDYLPL